MKNLNPTKLLLGFATPFVSAGSAWLVAAAAKYGLHLDPSGVNALGVAGLTAGAAAMVKLIHDVEGKPKVAAVLQTVEKDVGSVAGAVEAADPKAGAALSAAIEQAKADLQQQLNEFVANLPQAPAPAAPAVEAPAPAPVAPPAPTA